MSPLMSLVVKSPVCHSVFLLLSILGRPTAGSGDWSLSILPFGSLVLSSQISQRIFIDLHTTSDKCISL